MVVVVPALPQRHQREPSIVAAGIGRLVAARAPNVSERIDGKRCMRHCASRNHVAPQETVPAPQRYRQRHPPEDAEVIAAIQKPQLGVARKITNPLEIALLVLGPKPPSDVRVPETLLLRAVKVERSIR